MRTSSTCWWTGPWLAGDGRTVADAYLIGVARWGEDLRLCPA